MSEGFIRLTRYDDGQPLYFNKGAIQSTYNPRSDEGLTVVVVGNELFRVKESVENILRMLGSPLTFLDEEGRICTTTARYDAATKNKD